MLYFCDTEFTDFIDTRLISIGLISEDGKHEFYAEVSDYRRESSSDYVKNHIETLLEPDKYAIKECELSARLGSWLEELGGERNEHQICVDYQTDWGLIVDLLENQIPQNFFQQPFMLFTGLDVNIYLRSSQLATPDPKWFYTECRKQFYEGFMEHFYRTGKKQHHALEDAKGNRSGWIKANQWLSKDY